MRKLRELVLHIAEICKNDPEFGATKLNKILFFADFYAYSVFGKSITEEKYFHLPKGPAPKRMKQVEEELKSSGRAKIEERLYFGKKQRRLVPQADANTSIFQQKELDLVTDVIEALRGINASDISAWTHKLLPWLLTNDREEIPYNTAFSMYHVPTSKRGLNWGEKRLKELRASGNVTLSHN
ncbi:MAG: Panacea domain-containing protein [Candidatus Hodarchaeales archaeon]